MPRRARSPLGGARRSQTNPDGTNWHRDSTEVGKSWHCLIMTERELDASWHWRTRSFLRIGVGDSQDSVSNRDPIQPRIRAPTECAKGRMDYNCLSTPHETMRKVMGLHPIYWRFLTGNYLMAKRS